MATLGLSCTSALAVRSWEEGERGNGGEGVRLQVKERATDGLKYNVRECDGRDDAAHTKHNGETAHAEGGETRDNGRRIRQGALWTQSTTAAILVQLVTAILQSGHLGEFSRRAGKGVQRTTSADRSLAHLRSEAYVVARRALRQIRHQSAGPAEAKNMCHRAAT
jgi:hypothetical protein